MILHFKKIVNSLEKNAVKTYLISANLFLVVFLIYLSNVGALPFKNFTDFLILAVFGFIFALYRPGWAFLLFVGFIALENINLAPKNFGFDLRPYQFFAFLTIVSVAIRYFGKKLNFDLPKLNWIDAAVIIFAASGIFSSFFAENFLPSFKQSLIIATFAMLYLLTRTYIHDFSDIKRIFPFFASSSVVIILYGIWQNIRFSKGFSNFEIMPGRPNATFTEADWLGIYIVFLLSVIYALIYFLSAEKYSKNEISNSEFLISNESEKAKSDNWLFKNWSLNRNSSLVIINLLSYLFLVVCFMLLILTVARSAWLGAVVVSILYFVFCIWFASLSRSEHFVSYKDRKILWIPVFTILSFIVALGAIKTLNLSSFELGNRIQSAGSGLQEITVSCRSKVVLPDSIASVSELEQYSCRHINLEEIDNEMSAGQIIMKVYRKDPNVSIRAEVYGKSWNIIKNNPVLGVGWGNIENILGKDERGAALNASNIFLEIWLGAGVVGLLAFVCIVLYILMKSFLGLLSKKIRKKTAYLFMFLGIFAILTANLFNSGTHLGFLWVYLGISISLLNSKGNKEIN